MNRQEKEYFVNDFHSKIENAKVLLISHYKGLSVSDISDLRKTVKDYKANFKVTKNSLVKIAIKDTCYQGLEKHFHGPVAVTYSDDPASCAKALAPTIALFGWTGKPVIEETNLEAFIIDSVLISVW